MSVVDLFAGPGGWDVAAAGLGMDPIGFEWDADACDTRRAAGLTTVRADLGRYQAPDSLDLEGLIGSPPCPLFSAAGAREGVDWLPHLCEVAAGIAPLADDAPPEAALSLTPLGWVLRHRPRWVTLEQVPAVLPLWESISRRIGSEGYSTWTGVLNAADYGVPQTRQRAILVASLDKSAAPPEPTHHRRPEPALFGNELAPWVTMADALGLPTNTTVDTRRDQRPDGTTQRVGVTRPAPTFTAISGAQWQWERPATTVMGDPLLWPPGHKVNQSDIDAIQLTVEQATALQSFPAGYPFQGGKTSQFRQLGNAVPPLLARRILESIQ